VKTASQAVSVEFSVESHVQKLKILFPSFRAHTVKTLSVVGQQSGKHLRLMALYNQLHSIAKLTETAKETSCDLEETLVTIEQDLSQERKSDTQVKLSLYTLHQFCRNTGVKILASELQTKKPSLEAMALDIRLEDNFVLKNYGIGKKEFSKSTLELICLNNLGFEESIEYHTFALNNLMDSHIVENPSDILLLRNFRVMHETSTFFYSDMKDLAEALSSNLCKNSRELRLETLQVLLRFELLHFEKPQDPEAEISELYTNEKPCEIIQLMWDFERTTIGFKYEKDKENQLQRLEVMLQSGLVPQKYLELAYNFLIGCLWIKFTPIQETVQACIAAIIKATAGEQREFFVLKHIKLLKTVISLTQLSEEKENDGLVPLLTSSLNRKVLANESIMHQAYLQDTVVSELFLEVKDFFH
jgi:hypothetical protein